MVFSGAAWPGDVDLLLFNFESKTIAIIEFKKILKLQIIIGTYQLLKKSYQIIIEYLKEQKIIANITDLQC